MSLGIGLGAFMQGMSQGIGTGRTLVDLYDREQAQASVREGFATARQGHEVAVRRLMQHGEAPNAAEPAPLPAAEPGEPGQVQVEQLAPIPARRVPLAGIDPLTPLPNGRAPRPGALSPLPSDRLPQQRAAAPPQAAPAAPAAPRVAPPAGEPDDAFLQGSPPAGIQPGVLPDDPAARAAMLRPRAPAPRPAARGVTPADPAQGGQGLPDVLAAPRQPAGPLSRQAAEEQVGSVVDYYMRTEAPRVVERLLANGDVDRARQYQTWIRAEGTQRGMRSWAGLIRSAQAGDADGVLRFARQAYNNDEYSADGVSVTDGRVLRDGGNVTGMELTFRNRDGSERTERFNGTMDLYRQAISFLAPEQQFRYFTGELTAARAAVTGLATERRREGFIEGREVRAEGRAIRRDDRRDVVTDQREAQQQQALAERDVRQSWLRQAEAVARERGETVQQVQQRLEVIRNNLASTEQTFPRLTPEQQQSRVMQVFNTQRGAAESITQPRGGQAPVTVYRPPPPGQGLPTR